MMVAGHCGFNGRRRKRTEDLYETLEGKRRVGAALPGAVETNVMFVIIMTCRQIARFSSVDIDAV